MNQQLASGAWDPSATFSFTTIDCGVTATTQLPTCSPGIPGAGPGGPTVGTGIAVAPPPGTTAPASQSGPVTYRVIGFTDHAASTEADVVASGGSIRSCDMATIYAYVGFTGGGFNTILGIKDVWSYNGIVFDNQHGIGVLTTNSIRYSVSTYGNTGHTGAGLYDLKLVAHDGSTVAEGSVNVTC